MNKGIQLLADYTFYSKYSQKKPDGSLETWDEVVERIYAMHKIFTTYKGYRSKELNEAFESAMRAEKNKEFLSSQRARQFAFPSFSEGVLVHHSKGYNCLRVDTKFVTREGVKSFQDYKDGDQIIVRTHKGNWKKAVVKNFGKQNLNKITISRGDSKYEVFATENHRWINRYGQFIDRLFEGERLTKTNKVFHFNYEEASPIERVYWCYGFVAGGGSLTKGRNGEYKHSTVRLCRSKTRFADRFIECGFNTSQPASIEGDIFAYTGKYLKTLPSVSDNIELLSAFCRGLLDANGFKDRNESRSFEFAGIQSSNHELIEFIRKVFPVVGLYITSEENLTGQEANYRTRGEAYKFRIHIKQGELASFFKVDKIERNVSSEDVWCLEVEDDHSFVMSFGLSTGNCSSSVIDRPKVFSEIMYLLLCGCGVGYSIKKVHTSKLPKIANKIRHTRTVYHIGDSIEGWADAIDALMMGAFTSGKIPIFNYSQIRPKGSLIANRFKAPGPDQLENSIEEIYNILRRARGRQLRPFEVHRIICFIAQAVVSGGVRRSALIALFDKDDQEMIECKAKNPLWYIEGQMPELAMANNSIANVYGQGFSFEELSQMFDMIAVGDPGVMNFHSDEYTANPCGEIIQHPVYTNEDGSKESGFAFCNLVEINALAMRDEEHFYETVKNATFIATVQALYTDFKYLSEASKKIAIRDSAIGVGITALYDNPWLRGKILERGAKLVVEWNKKWADYFGIPQSKRSTTIKPSGNATIILGAYSSGVHPTHDTKYIRRVQTTDVSPEYLALKNTPMVQYNDQGTPLINFPIRCDIPNVETKKTIHPIDHMKFIAHVKHFWVNKGIIGTTEENSIPNNVSATVEITKDEREAIKGALYINSHIFTGITFLERYTETYRWLPYSSLDTPELKEEFDSLEDYLKTNPELDFAKIMSGRDDLEASSLAALACAGGACEIK